MSELRQEFIEFDDERRERMWKAYLKMCEVIVAETNGPVEAFGVLLLMMERFKEVYNITEVELRKMPPMPTEMPQ
jgi:hypothetical protein